MPCVPVTVSPSRKKPSVIIVTGGVLSGLGKGIAAASLGKLLNLGGLSVVPVKCEGYLNVDPGTMNPTEHGEVFVLEDGEEADMDFGHYERMLNVRCKAHWNITMGKIYLSIFEKERRGDFLGKTVQLIPHVTDLIKSRWKGIAEQTNADVLLIEIGGTVGDIETEMYVEAARQLKFDSFFEQVLYVHLTYVPVPHNVGEQKTKPTQQSVAMLRERGIVPDIIIGRCEEKLALRTKEKIALFCDVAPSAVISGHDVSTIYEVPLVFAQEGLVTILRSRFPNIGRIDLTEWKNLVTQIQHPQSRVRIAICGKYTALEDSYASVVEALVHAGAHHTAAVDIVWVDTEALEDAAADVGAALAGVDGIIIPGGFGSRGIEGKIKVITHVRENNIPFLGICYGLQLAVIEYARSVCGLALANTTEVDTTTPDPIITMLENQVGVKDKGGTMRLGAQKALLKKGTLCRALYGNDEVYERHRHRYEVNPVYHKKLHENGMVISGLSPDGRLAEFIELPSHPFFVATQAHPELVSTLERPAPLFFGLVQAALTHRDASAVVMPLLSRGSLGSLGSSRKVRLKNRGRQVTQSL